MDQQSLQTLQQLSSEVKTRLESSQPVVVFGIGSELLGDDRAGVAVARTVQEKNLPFLKGVAGCSAPENVTGEVTAYKPALVVLVDAADMRIAPGNIRLVSPEDISGVSFSTHSLPLPLIISYLKSSLAAEFLVAGIQPQSTSFSLQLSPAVDHAVKCLLASLLPQNGDGSY